MEEKSSLKKIIREAKVSEFLGWILLSFIIFIIPIFNVYVSTFNCDGTPMEKPFWLYILGIVVYNIFYVVLILFISLIGAIFAKIGQWVYESKGK